MDSIVFKLQVEQALNAERTMLETEGYYRRVPAGRCPRGTRVHIGRPRGTGPTPLRTQTRGQTNIKSCFRTVSMRDKLREVNKTNTFGL